MSKGYFAYPTYSVQGQQVDIASSNLSTPIDAAGSRVEFTDITFVNEGTKAIITPVATIAGNLALLNRDSSHELVLSGSDALAGATSELYRGGNKNIHFMPNLRKMSIEIGGQEYPGTSTFDDVGKHPARAYKLYKELYPEDERKIQFRDWVY